MSPTTSADPLALQRYADGAAELDADLRRLAGRLAAAATTDPGRAAATASLAEDIAGLASTEAATSRWVGSVGVAFGLADAGSWTTAPVIEALVDLARNPEDTAEVAETVEGLEVLGVGSSVMAAAARALGPSGLADLAHDRPDLVGPTDGMPPSARYAANRLLISSAMTDERDPDRRARLERLLRDDPATGRARQILQFDPRGDGRVAEVFGDLATATSVGVLVPGMSTDLDNFDRTVADHAADLAHRASQVANSKGVIGSVAVVAWLGYDPPDGWSHDLGELHDATGERRARIGGEALVALLAGLPKVPGQFRTLIGHSYGTTTVGAALLAGADVDSVVAMGSPGMLVDDVDELGRPHTDFYVLAARHDVIAELGWFGRSPTSPGSGFVRLEADGTGHSSYFVDGSSSQANVIAALLDRDDLLAPG